MEITEKHVEELPPLYALAETALAIIEPQDSVTRQSLRTVPKFPEQIEEGLVCTAGMDVHELAPIVIVGFAKLRQYLPYIKTFIAQCKDLARDSKNKWTTPVEGCHSLREFFENKCQRTPDAVYKMIRRGEQEEKQIGLPTKPPTPPKPPKKPAAVGKTSREIVLAADLKEAQQTIKSMQASCENAEKRVVSAASAERAVAGDADVITAIFFMLRRKSDGKFRSNNGWSDIERARVETSAQWSDWPDDLDNPDVEIVKVQATYDVAAVKP